MLYCNNCVFYHNKGNIYLVRVKPMQADEEFLARCMHISLFVEHTAADILHDLERGTSRNDVSLISALLSVTCSNMQ